MLAPSDIAELARAKELLERPNLVARVAHVLGTPIERGSVLLPEPLRNAIADATQEAVRRALDISVRSLAKDRHAPNPHRLHKSLAAVTGALGGSLGLVALAFELPLSTVLMLRSIAATARAHGEDLDNVEARLACVQVFALGGFAKHSDPAEAGYYASRTALAQAVSETVRHLAEKRVGRESAPALLRLMSKIAARFGVVVSDKVLLTAVPVLGAVSGAVINSVFVDYFQSMAEGHFTVRALERRYDAASVRELYETL